MDDAPPAARGDASDTTPAGAEANRANAARSTGPKTADGLARSSANALSHGLTARSVVVRGESAEQWETFRDATLADLDARGAVEHALATRVAELLWRLQRAGAAEAAVANFAVDRAERASLVAALNAFTGPGDSSPFGFRNADTIDELQARALRARAAGEAALKAYTGAEDERLDPAAAGDLVRLLSVLAGLGDPELVHRVAADEQARRIARGVHAMSLPSWTVAGMQTVAAGMIVAAAGDLLEDEDDDEESAEGASENDRTLHTEAAALLSRAHRLGLEAALRGLWAAKDARQRFALARDTAASSDDTAAVRRHEAHLQRQLAGALALLDAARARRPAPVAGSAGDFRTGVRVLPQEQPANAVAEIGEARSPLVASRG